MFTQHRSCFYIMIDKQKYPTSNAYFTFDGHAKFPKPALGVVNANA
jgi:hypothetical protein